MASGPRFEPGTSGMQSMKLNYYDLPIRPYHTRTGILHQVTTDPWFAADKSDHKKHRNGGFMAGMVKVGCYYVGEHITHRQYKGTEMIATGIRATAGILRASCGFSIAGRNKHQEQT